MKKKIDRCKYNTANIVGTGSKPYCAWHCMTTISNGIYSCYFPPHMNIFITPSCELRKDICKSCMCFEPITRS